MKQNRNSLVAIGILVALSLIAGTEEVSARNRNPRVLPPGSTPCDASYATWGTRWWQWALSIPADSNPVFDTTGASCGIGQAGPVWFLAGTSGGSVTRTCTVPRGKFILCPILNVIADYPCPDPTFQPPPGQSLEEFLQQVAQDYFISYVADLEMEVDGVALNNLFDYRATSSLFTFTGDPSLTAVFDPCITGTPQQGVSDGYWVMLAPLRVGKHIIHIRGTADFDGFIFVSEVTYHLTVAPNE